MKNKELILKLLLVGLIFTFPMASKINILSLGFLNLYAYRLVLLIGFAYLLFTKKLILPYRHLNFWILLFFAWLVIYGAISLLWVDNISLAVKQISYVFWGFLTFIVLFSLCINITDSLRVIKKSWLLSFLILAIIAIVEIGTSAHFEGTFTNNLAQLDSIRSTFNTPLATFGNPNDFAAFLVFSLILFFLRLGRPNRFFPVLFILLTIFIVWYTRSVLSLYAIYWVVAASVFIIFYTNNFMVFKMLINRFKNAVMYFKGNYILIIFIGSLFVFSSFYLYYSNKIVMPVGETGFQFVEINKDRDGMEIISEKVENYYFIKSDPSVSVSQTQSFNVRKNLIFNGLIFARHSYFMGIGAGQFEHKINNGFGVFPTMNRCNPHNFTIEIFSQYGIIPIIILAIFFIKIVVLMLKHFRKFYNTNLSSESSFLLMAIPAYMLVSNGPSSFISHPMNWIILTLIAYSAETLVKHKESVLIPHAHD